MTTEIVHTFDTQLRRAAALIRENGVWPSPDAAFCHYVSDGSGTPTPGLPSDLRFDPDQCQHAPGLAALGYLLNLRDRTAAEEETKAWRCGLDRLSKRNAFPGDRQSFAYRPVELLGIALGARATTWRQDWLKGVLTRLAAGPPDDAWSLLLIQLAAGVLHFGWKSQPSARLQDLDVPELCLARWIRSRSTEGAGYQPQELDSEILSRIAVEGWEPTDVARAAVVYHSLHAAVSERIKSDVARTWPLTRVDQDAHDVVVHLCRRFHLFARQLSRRRQNRTTLAINDEYDVQDALHAILRLHFDDVRAEEWTPSYGGTHSRMDFLLKAELLVVEVKMIRKGLDQREVTRQLAVDKEHYRAHPDCRTLVCFVYDPECRCENPTALETDASDHSGGLRTTVVVRPLGT